MLLPCPWPAPALLLPYSGSDTAAVGPLKNECVGPRSSPGKISSEGPDKATNNSRRAHKGPDGPLNAAVGLLGLGAQEIIP